MDSGLVSKTPVAGALIALGGAFTLEQWMAIIGVGLAILGTIINWYYKRKHYKLELAKFQHEVRMSKEGD